jgi:hypothetical protein
MQSYSNIKYLAVLRVHVAKSPIVVCSLANEKLMAADANAIAFFDASIVQVVSAPDFHSKIKPHVLHNIKAALNALTFIMDDDGRVFIVISLHDYPLSRSKALLDSFTTSFCDSFGDESLTVSENGLVEHEKARELLKTCMERYVPLFRSLDDC